MKVSMKSYLAVQVGYAEAFMNTRAIYNLVNDCLPDDVKLSNDLDKFINNNIPEE